MATANSFLRVGCLVGLLRMDPGQDAIQDPVFKVEKAVHGK